jgi:hypothetical protein
MVEFLQDTSNMRDKVVPWYNASGEDSFSDAQLMITRIRSFHTGIIEADKPLHATYSRADFLLSLFFDPEDGGDMFHRTVA